MCLSETQPSLADFVSDEFQLAWRLCGSVNFRLWDSGVTQQRDILGRNIWSGRNLPQISACSALSLLDQSILCMFFETVSALKTELRGLHEAGLQPA